MSLANSRQELVELGLGGTLFRIAWELGHRTSVFARADRCSAAKLAAATANPLLASALLATLPFQTTDASLRPMPSNARSVLLRRAQGALRGRLFVYGRHEFDYGDPPDWRRDPTSGSRWPAERHWSRALSARVGDVKHVWEIGRFPHAYHIARAALYSSPSERHALAHGLAAQIRAFIAENPPFDGVHWASGQEIAFRLMAWTFAVGALPELRADANLLDLLAHHLIVSAHHIERYLPYAQYAVYNNHLLSEALGLLLVGALLPSAPRAARWRRRGCDILIAQADRQFYPDGGYIQQSHNYHRVALQDLLWACLLVESRCEAIPGAWLAALARSVDFLVAQQNARDGRLPNYGANDGALPSILSTCDYSDFRPTLQAANLRTRGERLYPPGPWDEEALWLVGSEVLEAAPLREPHRVSISFAHTGYHVLRPRPHQEKAAAAHRKARAESFALFRCGTVLDRFSQIDMLHVDLWWRGQNVLVDPGSYLYNGPTAWHRHFMGTASHNTIVVDGHDQMLHARQFKTLYWTPASLLAFEDRDDHCWVQGKHTGYQRHPGGCVHRRAVLAVGADLWVVVDRLSGDGAKHDFRLHWVGGPFAHQHQGDRGSLELATPAGTFALQVLDERGAPRPTTCVAGRDEPPRGWLARSYASKEAVPSLVASWRSATPSYAVTIFAGGGLAEATVDGQRWEVVKSGVRVAFDLDNPIPRRM